jgi:hypothetical protein
VPQVKRIKILIHGQEVDTLAGHLDLTQTFIVNTKAAQAPSLSVTVPVKPSAGAPASQAPSAKGKEPRR